MLKINPSDEHELQVCIINGVLNSLEGYQETAPTRERQLAITKLEEAILWLHAEKYEAKHGRDRV